MSFEDLQLKPFSNPVNIGRALHEIIANTNIYTQPDPINLKIWNSIIQSYQDTNPDSEFHEEITISTTQNEPWSWTQDNNSIQVTLNQTRAENVVVTETQISSPRLKGTWWSPISGIEKSFDESRNSTIIRFHPSSHFVLLIKGPQNLSSNTSNEIKDINQHSSTLNLSEESENRIQFENDIDPLSCFYLAMLSITIKRVDFFLKWGRLACSQGEPNSLHFIGRYLLQNNERDEAMNYLARATLEHKDDTATIILSDMLWSQLTFYQNPELAEHLLISLCLTGNNEAYLALGKMYVSGPIGIGVHLEEGLRLLRIASEVFHNEEAAQIIKNSEDSLKSDHSNITDVAIASTIVALGGFVVYKFFKWFRNRNK